MTKEIKNIAILGAGESGTGAALLAKAKGMNPFVSDFGLIGNQFKKELIDANIEFEEGIHSESKILNCDLIIKSPGIPDNASIITKAKAKGIEVFSEIEFGGKFINAKTICITGTNGKTTTTLLTYHLLKSAGLKVGLAGNIGYSLARLAIEDIFDIYVLEISSFQLDGMYDFKVDLGIITNITPDHLDRYDYQYEKYIASKLRMLDLVSETGTLFYGSESEDLQKAIINQKSTKNIIPFGNIIETNENIIEENQVIKINFKDKKENISLENSPLKGKHNQLNTMVAVGIALKCGLTKTDIEKGLSTFINAPHRLEIVAEIKGVTFINDSKATNIDSAWYALDAIKTNIVWIVGGIDKGNDYNLLENLVREKVVAIICLGKDSEKLVSFYGNHGIPVQQVDTMEDCVDIAFALADEEETVLLSPCCASFDLFKNYEDRGNQFRDEVLKIKNSI